MTATRLSPDAVRTFIFGRALYAFDPETGARAAKIDYRADGTCHVTMADGSLDNGVYGFQEACYWTQYRQFRDGVRHHFYLMQIDEHTAQAYFADGTRAFLQTPKAQLG